MIEWLYRKDVGKLGDSYNKRIVQVGDQLWKLECVPESSLKMYCMNLETMKWIEISCKNQISIDVQATVFSTDDKFIYTLSKDLWKFDTSTLEWTHVMSLDDENDIHNFHIHKNTLYAVIYNSQTNDFSLNRYNNESRIFEKIQTLLDYEAHINLTFFEYQDKLHIVYMTKNRNVTIHRLKDDNTLCLFYEKILSPYEPNVFHTWLYDNNLHYFTKCPNHGNVIELYRFDLAHSIWHEIGVRRINPAYYITDLFSINGQIYAFHYDYLREVYVFIGTNDDKLETKMLVQIRETYRERMKKGESLEVITKEIDEMKYPEPLKKMIRDTSLWYLQQNWKWSEQ